METQKFTKVTLNSDLLQLDLMMEILKRLPVKTLIRFFSVSKLFGSIIRSGYFKKLYLNESLTRPKDILFIFRTMTKDLTLASVHPKNTHEASSYASASLGYITDNTRLQKDNDPYVHGLICYRTEYSSRLVIHNPSTRLSMTLPMIYTSKSPIHHYLGYDPIGNDYKVLCIKRGSPKPSKGQNRGLAEEIQIIKLGNEQSWRMIHQDDVLPLHSPVNHELCINGVLYYGAFL